MKEGRGREATDRSTVKKAYHARGAPSSPRKGGGRDRGGGARPTAHRDAVECIYRYYRYWHIAKTDIIKPEAIGA